MQTPKEAAPPPLAFAIIAAMAAAAGGFLLGDAVSRQYSSDVAGTIILLGILSSLTLACVRYSDKARADALPSDALDRFEDTELYQRLLMRGPLMMPPDGVDRQWLKEIETAVQAIPEFYHWSDTDPILRAGMEIARANALDKVRRLIWAARNTSGTRLPPRPAIRED